MSDPDTRIIDRPPLPGVVLQHVEEAAHLRQMRSAMVRAANVDLRRLQAHDERLLAHIDGVAVAREYGWKQCLATLDPPSQGAVFTAAVRAIERKSPGDLMEILSAARHLPSTREGLMSAFGWVSAHLLQGSIRDLLSSHDAWHRLVGIRACAAHGVPPGPALASAMNDDDADLRRAAFDAAGELAQLDLLGVCADALDQNQPDTAESIRYAAARAALLLGDRRASLHALHRIALDAGATGTHSAPALPLLLTVLPIDQGRPILKTLLQDAKSIRLVIRGTAAIGDPYYVPWLIAQAQIPELSRLAGESFSTITGQSLVPDLEMPTPEEGPGSDAGDEDVASDEDDALPWPDPRKLERWWSAHQHRYAVGTRYFMGEPLSVELCIGVLKSGMQRQRIAAALYLGLIKPGTPVFNTAAPAWRQQRALMQMGGK